jgi:hypothetical protein
MFQEYSFFIVQLVSVKNQDYFALLPMKEFHIFLHINNLCSYQFIHLFRPQVPLFFNQGLCAVDSVHSLFPRVTLLLVALPWAEICRPFRPFSVITSLCPKFSVNSRNDHGLRLTASQPPPLNKDHQCLVISIPSIRERNLYNVCRTSLI